ncbi:MAG: DR2241 family protein [Haloarculaceae archaeon]
MHEPQIDALVAAAAGGIDRDWLAVDPTDDGYDLSLPGPSYGGLSAEELRAKLVDHEAAVEEWFFWARTAPDHADHEAFLRWIERADQRALSERRDALRGGVERTWGQLRVRAELTDVGGRRYEVRHAADADEPAERLEEHADPLDARTIAKTDERGRYRPLSTAPTLRRGWVFVDLGPDEVVRTVDTVYPATVANWRREREGQLDVTHWHETAARQTGIYGVVETWDRGEGHDHVEWVAEACCDDSQCLKRREWEYDEDTDLDADGGDGEFPCREPCSLVIAGARKWTRLEAEESRTYEFELTPSEKEQVESIVDAVADGRAGDIREADFKEDANRYRVRYLRAKRFEDGDLCGVPSDEGQQVDVDD